MRSLHALVQKCQSQADFALILILNSVCIAHCKDDDAPKVKPRQQLATRLLKSESFWHLVYPTSQELLQPYESIYFCHESIPQFIRFGAQFMRQPQSNQCHSVTHLISIVLTLWIRQSLTIIPSFRPFQKVISKEVYLPFLSCRSYQYLIYIYVIWSLYCKQNGICDVFCLQCLHLLYPFNIFFQCLVSYGVYKFCRNYPWLNTGNPYVGPLAELLSKTFAKGGNGVFCSTIDTS